MSGRAGAGREADLPEGQGRRVREREVGERLSGAACLICLRSRCIQCQDSKVCGICRVFLKGPHSADV